MATRVTPDLLRATFLVGLLLALALFATAARIAHQLSADLRAAERLPRERGDDVPSFHISEQ
ncbi:hypothetical protein [Sphingomonas xinjiangensis]|uniref:Uncharacterized protein n=1 Tax=Sphingomonas xinjiangensis TaxID=643568 RepID=A0A840YK56_9SPHN|nr:hypothetical protein [Sphingomonas xinjiangensis]MBB5709310.1 hypothetical protein [Sphingomonas xinjiangensis]